MDITIILPVATKHHSRQSSLGRFARRKRAGAARARISPAERSII
jgi:hypothetical protein